MTGIDPLLLALKRCGGAADAKQLAANTGRSETFILGHLHALEGAGEVFEDNGTWRVVVMA